jgi:phosphoribosylanthranilate isomerase
MKTRIKVCGLTNLGDALAARELGAFALGFIFAESRRRVSPTVAKEIIDQLRKSNFQTPQMIGVFVDENLETVLSTVAETGLSGVQLHGAESPEYVSNLRKAQPTLFIIKAITITAEGFTQLPQAFEDCDCLLFDSNESRESDRPRSLVQWQRLRGLGKEKPYFIAGGLRADNLAPLLTTLAPYGVDVGSGIESGPGTKDLSEMKKFFVVAGELYV